MRLINRIFAGCAYQRSARMFAKAQIGSAVAMSFMHGAQDGQKFIGILLLGLTLNSGAGAEAEISYPLWLLLSCALLMALGTSFGGMRIIKAVGTKMVQLEKHQGFAADLAGAGSLLLMTLLGLPVSTTHSKTSAIVGVGLVKSVHAINWQIVRDMLLAWLLTFPLCGLLSYLLVKIILPLV